MKDTIISLTCLWFVFVSALAITKPKWVGQWQAKAEYAFILEAENLGLWSE